MDELRTILSNVIDLVAGTGEFVFVRDTHNKLKRVREKSASTDHKKNKKLWPRKVREKYPDVTITIRAGHAYASYFCFLTKKRLQKSVAHLVWGEHTGNMPAKGRRFRHVDGNPLNNRLKNLHPEDGVYE